LCGSLEPKAHRVFTEFYERQLSRLSSSEHSTRFLQKGLPGVRQFNVTPDPVKELRFVPIL